MMESGIVDFEPVVLPLTVADATCTRGYGYAIDLFSVFTTVTYAGYVNKAFLGVGQIDKYGNINTSFLGIPPEAQRITAAGGGAGVLRVCQGNDPDHEGQRLCRKAALPDILGIYGRGDERERSGPLHPRFRSERPELRQKAFSGSTKRQRRCTWTPFSRHDRGRRQGGRSMGPESCGAHQSFPVPNDEEINFLRHFSRPVRFPIKWPCSCPWSTLSGRPWRKP